MDASPQRYDSQRGSLVEPAPRIRCRQATAADATAIAALLARGFPVRSLSYWTRALAQLGNRTTPPDCPKYGYVLEAGERLIGVVLLIFSEVRNGAATIIRCNVSSWYVETEYRGFASLLIASALRKKDVTYVNTSPARHTRRTIELQGFTCYARGQFYALPLLAPPMSGVRIRLVEADMSSADPEMEMLAAHAGYGCLSVICEVDGQTYPFIFMRARFARQYVPGARLIYCHDTADFVRFAGPLGRFLLKRGLPGVILDSNGPVAGLIGCYFPGKAPKYYKGPHPPALTDIAFNEIVLFGS
jgi:hypothetical protein